MRLAASLLLAALALTGFAARPQEKPVAPADPQPPQERPRGERGERGRHDEEETPLMQQMEKIEHAMHFLRRSIKDATQDEKSLEQAAIAEQACLAAKLLTPKMAANQKEDERKAFVTDFRKGVAALLIEWVHLETALLDGDRGAAQEAWKKLDNMEEDGHNNFTEGD
jgi:soluble cytochrome b562